VVQNPYLKVAVEALLSNTNSSCESYFGATAFHKMMFLLYVRLKKRNINLKLPYSWYRYGPFMNSLEFERQVGAPLSYYAPESGSVRIIDHPSCDDISPENLRVIEQESQKLVEQYKEGKQYKSSYLDLLLDDAYKYAPFKFQKTFNRGFFIILSQFKSYNVSKEEVEVYLDNLMKIYPYKEMDELSDTFLEWDDTARLALNQSPSKVYNLAEDFWFIYSDLLQIKRNENISEDIIHHWRFEFPRKFHEYDRRLSLDRKNFLRAYRGRCLQDTEVQKIVRKMNDLSFSLAINNKAGKKA